MAYILGMNNSAIVNEKVFVAGAEAQAVQDFLCSHMAESMTVSEIEELIRKSGLRLLPCAIFECHPMPPNAAILLIHRPDLCEEAVTYQAATLTESNVKWRLT